MRVVRTANVGQWRAFLVQFVPLFRFSPKGYELGNIFSRILSFFCRIIKSMDKEKTLQITEFVGFNRFLSLNVLACRRKERDSNPRNPLGVYTLSRRASSTTRASFLVFKDDKDSENLLIFNRKEFFCVFCCNLVNFRSGYFVDLAQFIAH